MKALALLCAVQFLLVLDVTIVGVALPAIRGDLGFSAAGLQWVVSAYVLAFGGLLLLAGRLADVLGRRRLFAAGIAVFAAGSLACGLAVERRGADRGAGVPGRGRRARDARCARAGDDDVRGRARADARARHLDRCRAGRRRRGPAARRRAHAGARLAVDLPRQRARRPRRARPDPAAAPAGRGAAAAGASLVARLDLPGALAGTAAVVALVLALTRIEAGGYGDAASPPSPRPPSPRSSSPAASGARATRCCRRARSALRPLAAALIVSLVLTAATTPTLFFITLHLQDGLGWSPTATGAGYLPVVLAVIAGALLAPRLVGAHGAAAVMAGGLALIAAGVAALTGITPDGGFVTAVLPGEVLYGAGLGAGSVAATTLGTAALPAARQGLASGLLNTAAQVGTALGLAVLVAIAAIPAWSSTASASRSPPTRRSLRPRRPPS